MQCRPRNDFFWHFHDKKITPGASPKMGCGMLVIGGWVDWSGRYMAGWVGRRVTWMGGWVGGWLVGWEVVGGG